MTVSPALASLSEGICPLCNTRLDNNRVCAAGVQWDIHTGNQIASGMHYEGQDQRTAPCSCRECRPVMQIDEVPALLERGDWPSPFRTVLSDSTNELSGNRSYGIPQIMSDPDQLVGREVTFRFNYKDLEQRTVEEIELVQTDPFGIKYIHAKIRKLYGAE